MEDNARNGPVVVRFPPSPTGTLHVGSARTALFNYIFAAQHDGRCILRIEDTDQERSKPEFEADIRDSLAWLGLSFHESYRQSERGAIYIRYLERLLEDGVAYRSIEGEGEGRRHSILRFRNPGTAVSFRDRIRGPITFDTAELGDFIIARSESEPLYHLAAVVDDHEMGVSHVIRGEDHISNTARQILIQRAIGAKEPLYAHIPLILARDRSKLSKRHGAVAVSAYRKEGYIPEALVNYLALLGWHPEGTTEIFSMADLVKMFRLERVQKGGAIFDEEKLRAINREYLRASGSSTADIELRIRSVLKAPTTLEDESLSRVANDLKNRIWVLSDVDNLARDGELDFVLSPPAYSGAALVWKKGGTHKSTKQSIQNVSALLKNIPAGDWSIEKLKNTVMPEAERLGRGVVLWPMRYALSGRERSPDPFTLSWILGKDETLRRLSIAEDRL